MHFGISFLPDATPETKSAQAWFADALQLCDIAESAGLESVKITEHYLRAYGGYCPSPLAFLSAVAARTRNIRLITGCLLPAFAHPMKLAAETAMVDAISGGRLEVGFARAYLPYEFDCFGVDLDTSRERFEAVVDAVVRLWTEAEVTLETPFFRLDRATLLPRPVQLPHPPAWVAAVRSRQSFARIGELGMGLLVTSALSPPDDLAEKVEIYRDSFRPSPLNRDSRPRVALSVPLLIAPTQAEAEAASDLYLQRYYDVWADAAAAWDGTTSLDYPGYTGMVRAVRAMTPAKARGGGHALVGTAARVAEEAECLVHQLKLDAILWQIDFGAMPLALSRRTLTSFAEQVLPSLERPTPAARRWENAR